MLIQLYPTFRYSRIRIQLYPRWQCKYYCLYFCVQLDVNNNIYINILDIVGCLFDCIQKLDTVELASDCIQNSQTQTQTQSLKKQPCVATVSKLSNDVTTST